MVDVNRIEQLFHSNFLSRGIVSVNEQGEVSVTGNVKLTSQVSQLPVQFDVVEGSFECQHNQLTSLQGAPRTVGWLFNCKGNNLTSLEGAPVSVRGSFFCNMNPLISLQGAPSHVGQVFYCDYTADLPLLQLLNYAQIQIDNCPIQVLRILAHHAGTGKAGAIKAAVELVKAGFKQNARW